MPRPFFERTRLWAVVGGALVAAGHYLAPAPLYAQREDQRNAPEVRKLDLRGVNSVSKLDLERSISTSASECKNMLIKLLCMASRSNLWWDRKYLKKDEFRRDALRIRVFYWKRGYREATVDTAVTKVGTDQVAVTFDIHEGPPTRISALRVEYDSTLINERAVKKLLYLRAGDPLNLVVLDTMRLQFMLAMWDQGHADAVVDTLLTVDPVARSADVVLRVNPRWRTTVGTITVRGNEDVSVRTIQNSLMLHTGQLFRYSDLTESQRNLYESNLFRLAMFSVPPVRDSVKDILIDVRETKMREARVASGFNNVDFFQGDTKFTNYNMLGGARRLDVSGAIGNIGAGSLNGRGIFRDTPLDFFDNPGVFKQPTWQVSADLKQPAFLQRPANAVGIGVFAHRRAAPSVYIDRGYGGQVSFTRTLAPRAMASTAYRFEITRVEASDVYFCVNYGVCDNETIVALRQHQKLSPLQLSAGVDRSDIAFSPTKGYIARVDLEHASSITLSDYRYNRAFAEVSAYTHFRYPSRDPRAQVLAGHLRFGFVRALANGQTGIDLLHPSKRFYAGGSHSVRGFGENQLGPLVLTIPPQQLKDDSVTVLGAPTVLCDIGSVQTMEQCDPNSGRLQNADFTVRPVGGTSLLEGSIEYRMPFNRKMAWVVFLDAGVVGNSGLQRLADVQQLIKGQGAISPGVGFRYKSPVGPIRIDLGYNPRITQSLDVVTTSIDPVTGREVLVKLPTQRSYVTGGTASGFFSLFNRTVLHLSIGEAY